MNEFWTPEPIWRGECCYLLGGGSSLRAVDLSILRGRRILTINSSLGRAVDAGLDDGVLFFTDSDWFVPRKEVIARWRGLVVTTSRSAKAEMPKVRRVQSELKPAFPALGAPVIRKGRSSGHTAVGLAVALGAARVVLLGYDMRVVDGRSHHHDDYRAGDRLVYEVSFIPAFNGWNAAALKVGVQILNASVGSALREFPMADLNEVLRGA